MADVGEEEYESDPEQAKLSLKMRRRREASDDEEEEENESRNRERRIDFNSNSRVSDYESDEQGAAAEYDYEESELDEEEEVEVEEEEFVERRGVTGKGLGVKVVGEELIDGVIVKDSVGEINEDDEQDNVDQIGDNVNGSAEGQGQEEKKENEPFAVPTAGAFYMHDDRFRDSVGGRHRRGGRKLWESRDDKKWGHDKFEELTLHERRYDEGRRGSRGRNRPRGRNRGGDREYSQGNRPIPLDNDDKNNAPKSVRGKGPRRYRPANRNDFEAPTNNRRNSKSMEKASHASTTTSTSESAQFPSRKNTFASSLNSASPPFYPSNKEINSTQKKDSQTPNNNRNTQNFPISQSNTPRGKNVSDSLNMNKLYIDNNNSNNNSISSSQSGKPTSGPFFNNPVPTQQRNRGRGQSQSQTGQLAYQPVLPQHSQTDRGPSQNQVQSFNRSSSGSRASSPPKITEVVNLESNNSKIALIGKGKGGIQSNGISSFPYGGNHGDGNFPSGTPTFLPVMQFAGQHPGGIGVPAVGMAFPGYVGQPNGMGNSEMTWLPVLAGAAGGLGAGGALGATYGSPYITMDAAYHARTSGQSSSLTPASSKDSNEPINKVKPTQRSELANDDLGQRQNKARRYTEMKFDQ